MRTVLYKRATFVTHLPVEHLYTHSHGWLSRVSERGGGNRWRVGYTKFAYRMLGELVDIQFERKESEAVHPGDVIGTIEGFKAISDIFCVGDGRFIQANPALAGALDLLNDQPYSDGWLYEFEGAPDARAVDLQGYRNLLDATIDRMLHKEQESKANP